MDSFRAGFPIVAYLVRPPSFRTILQSNLRFHLIFFCIYAPDFLI